MSDQDALDSILASQDGPFQRAAGAGRGTAGPRGTGPRTVDGPRSDTWSNHGHADPPRGAAGRARWRVRREGGAAAGLRRPHADRGPHARQGRPCHGVARGGRGPGNEDLVLLGSTWGPLTLTAVGDPAVPARTPGSQGQCFVAVPRGRRRPIGRDTPGGGGAGRGPQHPGARGPWFVVLPQRQQGAGTSGTQSAATRLHGVCYSPLVRGRTAAHGGGRRRHSGSVRSHEPEYDDDPCAA